MFFDEEIFDDITQNVFTGPELDLSYHVLSAANLQNLVNSLSHNLYIVALNLNNSNIDDEGAAILAQNGSLKVLNLAHNKIGPVGAKSLANSTSLVKLDLSSNEIEDEGAESIAKNQSLKVVNLANCEIGPAGAKALAKNISLIELDLTGNEVGNEGAQALSNNTTLLALYIFGGSIGNLGVKALAQSSSLTSLELGHNNFSNEGVQALAQNKSLTSLDIKFNVFSDSSAEYFLQNSRLLYLNMVETYIDETCVQSIQAHIATNKLNAQRHRDEWVRVILILSCIAARRPHQFISLDVLEHVLSFFIRDDIGKTKSQQLSCARFIIEHSLTLLRVDKALPIIETKDVVGQPLFRFFQPVMTEQAEPEVLAPAAKKLKLNL